MHLSARWLCMTVLLFAATVSAADFSTQVAAINDRLVGQQAGTARVGGEVIYQPMLVSAFYNYLDFQPAWPADDYALQVLNYLEAAEDEGLNPRDYHVPVLRQLQAELQDEAATQQPQDTYRHAQFDVLLTDGLLLYTRHLLEGKVDPRQLDPSWNYTLRDFDPEILLPLLTREIRQRSILLQLQALLPQERFYLSMKRALALHRRLGDDRGYTPVPPGPLLRPGRSDPRVVDLRRRLWELRYLKSPDGGDLYSADLEQAVMQMQRDFGLDDDGLVGAMSYAVLNLNAQQKIDMLRVNMDRFRWVRDDIASDMIVVNIAGFELYLFRDGELRWTTPVMTGTVNTQTPIFHAPLRYLEFNPTWNVPRSILERSLLPKFQADAQYALDKGYSFYAADGTEVPATQIDFSRHTGASFPFRVVQQPGPDNAMGRVKFMFPNRHAVYLHDTPSRELFRRSARAFSAGCIRVYNPMELARQLLNDPREYSAEALQQILDSGKPRQVVRMQSDVDVILMYWTVSPSESGRVRFHEDVYRKDAAALAALNGPPEVIPLDVF